MRAPPPRPRHPAALAVLLLLSACSAIPRLATPTPPAVPVLPTDTAVPTPLPDPVRVARAYLDAWIAEDFTTMYSWLTPLSQEGISLDTFTSVYTGLSNIMSLNQVYYEVLSSFAQGRTAQVAYRVHLETILVGEIVRDTQMELTLADGLWRIQWDQALILPELTGDRTLAMEYRIPARGDIYDRNGHALVAGDTNAVSVGLIAGATDPFEEDTLFYELWILTGLTPEEIQDRLDAAREGWYVPLAEVPAALVEADFDLLETFDGLVLEPYTSRYYFGGGIAPQAIGYVSLIQPEEAGTYERLGYRVDERIGRIGLERWGEPFLAGARAGALYVVTRDGRRETLLAETQAGPAGSIYTTLDRDLQIQLQAAMQGLTGAIVVLERDTGRILALVSSPGYDPNLFEPANLNSDYLLSGLLSDPRTPLLNRATQGQYPLGSVFKIITMAAGLESGRYSPTSSYYCGHYFTEIAGLSRADWTVAYQVPPSGQLDLREGLMRSCNPWFWHIGLDLFNAGLETGITETALGFGLGTDTGLAQLVEAGGNIPVPVNPIDAINLAIGQGDTLVTPLQVARFIAAIGNGGELLRPQIVEQVLSGSGEPVYRFKVESLGSLPIRAETLEAILQGLDWVVNQPRGTAHFQFTGLGIPIAGKTGTAEAPPNNPHAWFAGYTLAEDPAFPDLAIAVVLEHGGEGSQVAAPLFRRVVEIYFLGWPVTPLPWEEALPVPPPEN
ncbi:MAG TPA: penicillin-binding transpeptidase domain-containing protein [Anaerolineales bacterium]|nr:penicillin-binding transpeptidase domain-containing protein [Anaerolineales bacterium]